IINLPLSFRETRKPQPAKIPAQPVKPPCPASLSPPPRSPAPSPSLRGRSGSTPSPPWAIWSDATAAATAADDLLRRCHCRPPQAPPVGSLSLSVCVWIGRLVRGGWWSLGEEELAREEEGRGVIVVDNFFTGLKDNLREWIGHPRFELIRHETLLVEVDQIYHLACPASPIFYKYNHVKVQTFLLSLYEFLNYYTTKTNVIGTLNMLDLAKRVGARILLTSTSEAYGDPLEHPQKEEYWGNVNPIEVEALAVVLVEIIDEVKTEAEV
ncbi:hypothetical protein Taro_026164, partial [Colocasia esculenta]|nr:hypothetical protein [Colocasia esculenta]